MEYTIEQFFDLISNKKLNKVKEAIAEDPSKVNAVDNFGEAAFFAVLDSTFHRAVDLFLKSKNFDFTVENSFKNNILQRAVQNSQIFVIKKILATKKLSIDSKGRATGVPLVAMCPNEEVLKIILKENPNVNAKDKKRLTALDYNILSGRTEKVKLLLAAGANVYSSKPQPQDKEIIKMLKDVKNKEKVGKFARLLK